VKLLSSLLAWNSQYISGPLHDSQLETKTNSKEWNILFARIFDSKQHSFCPTNTETTGDQDAAVNTSEADHIGLKETLTLLRRGHAMRRDILQDLIPVFQIQDPMIQPTDITISKLLIKKLLGTNMNDEFAVNAKCRVFKRFYDGHIGILQVCIFSNKSNGYRVKKSFLTMDM